MLLDIRQSPRVLYIIAPTLMQCHRTATEWGLDPRTMQNVKCVTKAYSLRGVTAGTAFIAHGREFWRHSEGGFDLDQAVAAYQRTGKLRIAQEDDLAACRVYDTLPSRPAPAKAARAGL